MSSLRPHPGSVAREGIREKTEKACRKCGAKKKAGEFPANPRLRDGLDSWCRACHRETRRWRLENPDKVEAANIARQVVPSYVYEAELKTYVPNPSLRPKSKVR